MSKWLVLGSAAALLVTAAGAAHVHAQDRSRTLVVTMTNDSQANEIAVYDAATGGLLQTLPTNGKGGVGGNARGVAQHDDEIFAAVNNGSNTVALFRRDGSGLRFETLLTTSSAPVSVAFGNGHLYVAGATTVDSFALPGNRVQGLDGTTVLELTGGGVPPDGSTAQVGVLNDSQLLVTLKADPDPGTVDIVALRDGAVASGAPTAVSAPSGSLAPFGFSVNRDGTALITLAHSAQDGLFRDGGFAAVTSSAGQLGPCWTTRVGPYVFTANTGSGTISRLISTGTNVFVDDATAASIPAGRAPLDIDADGGLLALLDHGAGQSHLSLFSYNEFGELTSAGAPITVDAANANGVAVLAPPTSGQR